MKGKFRLILILLVLVIVIIGGVLGWVFIYYANIGTHVESVYYQSSDGVQLAGRLVLPSGDGPHPAVVQVGGSDREGRSNISARIHATVLAWNGVAVLFYDKRGVADSEGKYYYADFRNTVADIHAGFDYLQTRDDIDGRKLGYIGHSEGGHLMPEVVLARDDIKFAYARVAPVLGYRHFSRFQRRIRFQSAGLTEDEIADVLAFTSDAADHFVRSVGDPAYHEGPALDALQSRLDTFIKKHGAVIQQLFGSQVGIRPYRDASVRRIAYYLTYRGADFLEQNSGVPMLYIYAALDENVDTASSVGYLEDLKRRTGQDIDIFVYPREDHSMHKKIYLPFGGFPPGYLGRVTDWIVGEAEALDE